MKIEIEIRFKPGDVVWRKNLVTNEAYQVTITRVSVFYYLEKEPEYIVLYHVGDGQAMTCIPGKVDANNAFATKEEADACPPYSPGEKYDDALRKG
jgi:hypothetical protein